MFLELPVLRREGESFTAWLDANLAELSRRGRVVANAVVAGQQRTAEYGAIGTLMHALVEIKKQLPV